MSSNTIKNVVYFQALYYFLTGIWPLIDIRTFMMVTGPKTDIWLVKMVGILTVAIALNLFYLLRTKHFILLAISSALGYLLIDVYYSLNGTISLIYLADAFVQLILISTLLLLRRRTSSSFR
jgi:hypothetical protein